MSFQPDREHDNFFLSLDTSSYSTPVHSRTEFAVVKISELQWKHLLRLSGATIMIAKQHAVCCYSPTQGKYTHVCIDAKTRIQTWAHIHTHQWAHSHAQIGTNTRTHTCNHTRTLLHFKREWPPVRIPRIFHPPHRDRVTDTHQSWPLCPCCLWFETEILRFLWRPKLLPPAECPSSSSSSKSQQPPPHNQSASLSSPAAVTPSSVMFLFSFAVLHTQSHVKHFLSVISLQDLSEFCSWRNQAALNERKQCSFLSSNRVKTKHFRHKKFLSVELNPFWKELRTLLFENLMSWVSASCPVRKSYFKRSEAGCVFSIVLWRFGKKGESVAANERNAGVWTQQILCFNVQHLQRLLLRIFQVQIQLQIVRRRLVRFGCHGE